MKVQLMLRRKEIEGLSQEIDKLKRGISTSYVAKVENQSYSK